MTYQVLGDLSEMLLAGTKESHTKLEISQLGRDFYKGIVKKDVLKVCFLLNCIEALYFIYSAMEDELERNKDHPYIAPIYFPTELYRREALAQDLQYFYGVDWESLISPSPATTLWVKRIHEVGKKDPGMLVAHCYVRYIGDLSGGHMLNNVAKKVLRLPATGEGLRFYQFEGITSHKGFKQLYRSKLNEVDVEMETKLSIVDEAIRAYDYSLLVSERARCLISSEPCGTPQVTPLFLLTAPASFFLISYLNLLNSDLHLLLLCVQLPARAPPTSATYPISWLLPPWLPSLLASQRGIL
uniref:heme oxygenase (biliverdin-producing) n=1 Tax=Poecilia latipinna TaxID=48699 RepID=A0A3B3V5F6_9TELE